MNSPQERSTGYGTTQGESSAASGVPTAASAPGPAAGTMGSGRSQQASTAAYAGPGRHSAAAATGIYLAGILMILGGLLDFFAGLAAIVRSGFYHAQPHYAFQYSIHGWGWITLIVGVVVLAVGACLLLGQTWARVVGDALVLISAVANFVYLPYYPVWAIVVIGVDVFVLWALTAGWRRSDMAEMTGAR